jgi:hypothetical protein
MDGVFHGRYQLYAELTFVLEKFVAIASGEQWQIIGLLTSVERQ